MADAELQLQVMDQEAKQVNSTEKVTNHQKENYKKWFRISVYAFLLLASQSTGTLLGRLYFNNGGNSKWLSTLLPLIAFPILLPLYLMKPFFQTSNDVVHPNPPSSLKLAFVYFSLGTLIALDSFLYSFGLMYLPVSTYSLICASQLAFNAFFSFFLNSLKFTPFILNSLILLTISSALLVFQTNDNDGGRHVATSKYAVGFICTVAASAICGLVLSLTQFAFRKVIKSESFKAVMDIIIYQAIVSSGLILIGFFASGDWRSLRKEIDLYESGKVSYVMNLVWTAISWQVFSVGSIGLIFEVSSLFSNAISALGLPIVPIFAAIFFHDKMDGVKVTAIVLAVWGFVSYGYQNYLDDFNAKVDNGDSDELPKASP